MKKTVSIMICTLMITTSFITITGTAVDWPKFGFDLHNTGHSPETNIEITGVVWEHLTSSSTALSGGMAVADNKVYVGTAGNFEKKLYCLNAEDGEQLWSFNIGGKIRNTPTVANDKLYVSGENSIYCLNAESGEEIWNITSSEISITSQSPIIHEGKLYQHENLGGYLYCLNADNGSFQWRKKIGSGVIATPAFDNEGHLYIGSFGFLLYGYVHCFNATTGAEIWKEQKGGVSTHFSPPAIIDDKVMISSSSGDKQMFCLNKSNGDTLWNISFEDADDDGPSIADGKVYCGFGPTMYCFDAETGVIDWSVQTGNIPTKPAIADGKVFFGTYPGDFYALDAATGDIIYTYTTEGPIKCNPAVSNEKVFIGSDDGKVYSFGYAVNPVLEIGNISGGLLTIEAEIKNTGDTDAIDVEWNITIDGGIILAGAEASGTIDVLEQGSTELVIDSPIVGLGGPVFGPVHISVQACSEGVDPVSTTVDGFVFLIFVII